MSPAAPIVVYHVAAMGDWQDVAREQLRLLRDSGLGAEIRCTHVVGGLDWLRAEAMAAGVELTVVRGDPNTDHYETFAMLEIERLAKQPDCCGAAGLLERSLWLFGYSELRNSSGRPSWNWLDYGGVQDAPRDHGSTEGPAMTVQPFSTFPIRGKKDAIRARHRARQIASLLRFPLQEQACIAAGTFAVVCQALDVLGKAVLCFQLADHQLQVYIRTGGPVERRARRSRHASADGEGRSLMRLVKQLPEEQPMSEADLAWLVQNADESPVELFEEVVKQNQEMLGLLHELAASRRHEKEGEPAHPSAA